MKVPHRIYRKVISLAIYKYVGRTKKGKLKRGTVTAVNKTQAINKLREMGISPRDIHETKRTLYKEITLGNPVNQQEFVVYCRQFATLIRSGISLIVATNILAQQTDNKVLKNVLTAIEEDVRTGMAFSAAAEKHPKIFPPFFVNMVRAGEATGNLDDTLDRLANYLEKQYDIKKKVQSALVYPVTLIFIIIAVIVFLMLTVVPQFSEIFNQYNLELPVITKFLIGVSKATQSYWWLGLLILALGIFIFSLLMRKNENFRYGVNVVTLKMPAFGKLLQKSALARMSRTMASLFASSVPVIQSLTIAEKVAGNPVIGKVILEARDSLERGNKLSEPFKKSWIIPPFVTQMIAIGEETGTIEFMFEKVADFYEAEVDRTVNTLKSLIEPVLILLLAVVVGIIVLAIMVPIFTIYQQF